jgi:hypothetical protein
LFVNKLELVANSVPGNFGVPSQISIIYEDSLPYSNLIVVNLNDFNLLKGIALSPLVQRYNDLTGVWQRVLVDDTDLTWDTKTPRNTVSYEFQLIDEQTQW